MVESLKRGDEVITSGGIERFRIVLDPNDTNPFQIGDKVWLNIERISNKDVGLINKNGKFYSNYSNINKCDVIIICVPTPLKKDDSPDLSFIKNYTRI